MRSQSKIVPRFRVMRGGEIALGPGKVALLRELQRTGSIVEAARHMEMSYMRAWKLIQTMNACFREPLVIAERGGKTRGGARLTEGGKEALALYERIESKSIEASRSVSRKLMNMLRPP
jgi:molybdate transport system regulatory protein